MFNCKKGRLAVLILASSVTLTACGDYGGTVRMTTTVQETETNQPAPAGPDENHNAGNTGDTINSSHASSRQAGEAEGNSPIVSLPEKDVYLYPAAENTALLQIRDKEQELDWMYSNPRMVMPVLQMHDYDRDGAEELAAVLHVASGTGLAIDELHIVEFADVPGEADKPFIDHLFQEEDYLAQLRNVLQFETFDRDDELFGRITVDGEPYEVSLKTFADTFGEKNIQEQIGFGAIVYFRAEGEELSLSAAVGLIIDGVAEPQYFGEVEAAVQYSSGAFKLSKLRFLPNDLQ
ncbi:hypothetical protein [Paenibacillus tarimensis]|uniref:hypothetical protein n=1 Tax=Paenibacillus tarimensis TaxID=416012 RepID=UPI001F263E5C|nr:hypothetical protein [Paenibacillus tarimensis]MCF2945640.1 hypothetical protein [Paenibacillus tarimensis]